MTDVPVDMTSYFISAGAVPTDMVASATSLSNPFGGNTTLLVGTYIGNPYVVIAFSDIPQGVCARLLTASSGSDYDFAGGTGVGATTLVSSGYMFGGANAPGKPDYTKPYAMNPTQAGWMCKYGAQSYTDKTAQPSSAPISGNVNMSMVFLVEA